MAQVTGICRVRADGKTFRTKDGAKFDPGGVERVTVVGTEVHGYAEKPRPSSLECTVAHTAEINIDDLRKMKNVQLEFECDTGPVFTVNGAWLAEPPVLTAGEGDLELKFAGPPADQD